MRRAIFFLLFLTACCPKHYPQIVYRDSIQVEIRERLVHDTVSFEVPVIIDRNVTLDTASHLENEWAKSDAVISDGYLSHSLETKGRTVYIPVTTVVHDTVTVETHTQEAVVEKIVEKPLTWWQRLRLRAFWPLLGAVLALVLWIYRKPLLGPLHL